MLYSNSNLARNGTISPRLAPDNADAYYGKGEALHFLNRGEEALAVYNQAINLDTSTEIWHGKIVGYREMGWSKEA